MIVPVPPRQRHNLTLRSALVLILLAGGLLACNISFTTTLPMPVVTARPAVVFLAPDPNSAIVEGAPVQIAVSAHDGLQSAITRVDFAIDGIAIGSATAPHTSGQADFTALQIWTAQGIQGHLIDATAYRADNSVVGDAAVTITVSALVVPPTATASPVPSLTPSTSPSFTPSVTIVTIAAFALASPNGSPTPLGTPPPSLPPLPALTAAALGTSGGAISRSPQPTINGPALTVLAPSLNVRGGPSTVYPVIGAIPSGTVAAIVGRNADRSWFVVQNGSLRGWVINSPSFLTTTGDLSALPLVAAPPSPIPQNGSPTPAPVLAWTSTPS